MLTSSATRPAPRIGRRPRPWPPAASSPRSATPARCRSRNGSSRRRRSIAPSLKGNRRLEQALGIDRRSRDLHLPDEGVRQTRPQAPGARMTPDAFRRSEALSTDRSLKLIVFATGSSEKASPARSKGIATLPSVGCSAPVAMSSVPEPVRTRPASSSSTARLPEIGASTTPSQAQRRGLRGKVGRRHLVDRRGDTHGGRSLVADEGQRGTRRGRTAADKPEPQFQRDFPRPVLETSAVRHPPARRGPRGGRRGSGSAPRPRPGPMRPVRGSRRPPRRGPAPRQSFPAPSRRFRPRRRGRSARPRSRFRVICAPTMRRLLGRSCPRRRPPCRGRPAPPEAGRWCAPPPRKGAHPQAPAAARSRVDHDPDRPNGKLCPGTALLRGQHPVHPRLGLGHRPDRQRYRLARQPEQTDGSRAGPARPRQAMTQGQRRRAACAAAGRRASCPGRVVAQPSGIARLRGPSPASPRRACFGACLYLCPKATKTQITVTSPARSRPCRNPERPPPISPCPATAAATITLSALRPGKVVLYFYPKDDTPGCTLEAQDFTARLAEFAAAGTTVIGVSKDSVKAHDKFCKKHGLRIVLASDEGGHDLRGLRRLGREEHVWQDLHGGRADDLPDRRRRARSRRSGPRSASRAMPTRCWPPRRRCDPKPGGTGGRGSDHRRRPGKDGARPRPCRRAGSPRARRAHRCRSARRSRRCAPPGPTQPELLPPRDVPRRRPGSPAGRIALLHAVAHIELNAVDLHWDIIARFTDSRCRWASTTTGSRPRTTKPSIST